MQSKKLSGLGILFAICACGGTSSGTGNVGPDGGNNPAHFTLTINVNGVGSVTSPDGAVNCAQAACTSSVPAGTAVHLDATPAAGTQFTGWTGACSGTGGCDLTLSADTTVGATFSVLVSVELDGTGGGHVTSSPAGIDCTKTPSVSLADVGTGSCSMLVANGTPVTLTATADAASNFSGYGGLVCHGTSCALTAAAAAKIFVTFESKTPSNVQHALTVTVTGSGTVTSQPPAISCPGTCQANFAQGSAVVLVATPASGATFTGWSGACTGTADCSVGIAADAAVTATFSTVAAPPSSCTGLVPSLANSKTYTVVPTSTGTPLCKNPVGDGAGNVYVEALNASAAVDDGEAIFNGTKPVLAGLEVTEPLQSGFTVLRTAAGGSPAEANRYTPYNPDGSNKANDNVLPGPGSHVGKAVGGGTVTVTAECTSRTNPDGSITFQITHFDDAGNFLPRTPGTFSQTECPAAGGVTLADANGNTLIMYETGAAGLFGIAAQRVAVRWFDANDAPLTDWFDGGPQGTGGFAPLIGGGVAVSLNGSWTNTITSGKAELKPAPSFLEKNKIPVIAFGGKGYAMMPDFASTPGASTPDVVAADGTSCGPLTSPAFGSSNTFALGKDGTLIDLQGTGSCDVTYFPQALK